MATARGAHRGGGRMGGGGATHTAGGAGTRAGRPQPQTTIEPPGGPFLRYSHPGRRPVYKQASVSYGGLVSNPLVAAPGYLARIRVACIASGGGGTVATYSADAPFNAIQNVTLKDAFGTVIVTGEGWPIFYCLPKYNGQFGLAGTADVRNLSSFSAGATSGNFSWRSVLPLEFAKGYGLVSLAAADLLPTLTFQLNPSTTPYATAPGTVPTVEIDTAYDFYWIPEGHEGLEPPGLGTTLQWVQTQMFPDATINAFGRLAAPRQGGYLTDLMFICRDTGASSARVDTWPDPVQIYIDGTPVMDTALLDLMDDMDIAFQQNAGGGAAAFSSSSRTDNAAVVNTNADAIAASLAAEVNGRPRGVFTWSRRTSLSQQQLGLLDTLEQSLSTNPGTNIEIAGNWANVGTGPFRNSVLFGQIVPRGNLAFGLPEV